MADVPPGLIAAAQAETGQWMAGLRDQVLNASPETAEFARRMATAITCQHPGTTRIGQALVTAARGALICGDMAEEANGAPFTATGLANLIGATGLVLIAQEENEERPDAGQDVRAVFAAAVLRERLARGWTGAELARRSGITQGAICNIERGRNGATLHVAAKLAQALGTTIGALADGAGDGRG